MGAEGEAGGALNAVAGNSFVLSAYGSNFGSMFIILDEFENRRDAELLRSDNVAAELRKRFTAGCPEAQVHVFGAPAVSGLGRAGGFRIMIEDRGDVGAATLQGQTEASSTRRTSRSRWSGCSPCSRRTRRNWW